MYNGQPKKCSSCGVEYPRTKEHYFLEPRNKEKLCKRCKHCMSAQRYGLDSVLDKENLRTLQDNKCPMCNGLDLPANGGAKIDHDHKIVPYGHNDPRWKEVSKAVKKSSIRGLLCGKHNIMVGYLDIFFADEGLQVKYQQYLENPPAKKLWHN